MFFIENDNRRIGGDRNYDRNDGVREPQRDDRKYGDRRDMHRDGRNQGKSYGNEESQRNKTPPPMKKIEEAKVPVSKNYNIY